MADQRDALVVIGAGILQRYMIREAQAMGYAVIATDGDAQALAASGADIPIVIDTYDAIGTATLLGELQKALGGTSIQGVVTCGADVAPTVAACAQALGVRGIPAKIAQQSHNKFAVRKTLHDAGLEHYQPAWELDSTSIPQEVLQQWKVFGREVPFPCVVKPLSQRASRGVTLVQDIGMLHEAVAHAKQYGSAWLIEELLFGTEHSAECLFDADGNLVHFHVCDRMFDYSNGTGIEIGHVNPTSMSDDDFCATQAMVLRCAQALGVTFGPFKVDVMLTADGPKVLECTGRCSGGFDSQVTYPLSTGHNLLRDIIHVAVAGHPREHNAVIVEPQRYAACAAVIPARTGVIHDLPSTHDIDAEDLIWLVKRGDLVTPHLDNCAQRPGFVIATADTYDDAWEIASIKAQFAVVAMEIG